MSCEILSLCQIHFVPPGIFWVSPLIIIIIMMIIIIIIIIFIYCNWVVTRWQLLFYMYTKHEIGYY
jgi:hypothetical protein